MTYAITVIALKRDDESTPFGNLPSWRTLDRKTYEGTAPSLFDAQLDVKARAKRDFPNADKFIL